ncbi:fibronectin/fibrinogen-binding protein [Streptococcus infantarius subsp. infantarius]|jgi:predicted ribosome quality control (RQC) complex YloA/Tae2 family protein|uniref:Rqc2 family fibronectin-binding protein n=1 Tax=Streptococcus TaxID=1301 RepID=UPI000EE73FFB|nr:MULTISPECIES: NFACT RNA binding domain-containing protein [Streptococcus]MBT0896594.1 NFACT family protein [Streptococcus infantarius subsp. infantarius]MBT0900927.1 NFACT family protein [Streptococcus infantarius subsp. infantarius]MBT0904087.1 NFACT family protein [Streptococcus infantarius subsp. infantarius]MBT0918000.1 NFACT family protein [Streptococcus infantarius subsp. infantarius]MBT1034512.1 NFACT family protein [Streptococcus infantarius subsp. infantarius]
MSFDGFFLHHLTKELQDELLYGRIQKVNQPFEHELVLTIRNNRKNYKMLLSAHPVFGRLQITKTDFQNPQTPNTFTMIMRKYLQGAVIENITQIENDRVLEIAFSNKNEIGDNIKVTLVVEIMGKHSNIILIDKAESKIIESIKHIGFSQNSYRTILPGSTYIAPPKTDAKNPFTVSDEKLFEILQTEDLAPRHLQKLFQGLGRDTAENLAAQLSDDKLKQFRAFFARPVQPNMTDKSFAAVPFDKSGQTFDSLSELLDVFYQDKAERDRVNQQSSDLIHRVQTELDKNIKKLAKQEKELAATENAEEFRQKGELLTTYLSMVPNNQDQVELDNYYTNEKITIALDKSLTPNQNAQRYFKKYQKLKEAVKHLTGLIEETKHTITYLESVETALSHASISDIEDIREELVETGFVKRRTRDKRHKRKKPEQYLASDGKTIIMVGRNNLQNDELTFKMAKKGELWFHAKDIPGSHVLIKDNLNPSDEVKTDAAELAAYYSKARLSNLIQVDMIEAKKLNKPTGAKPGFVTYTGQKTLRVTPTEEKINSMRIENKK